VPPPPWFGTGTDARVGRPRFLEGLRFCLLLLVSPWQRVPVFTDARREQFRKHMWSSVDRQTVPSNKSHIVSRVMRKYQMGDPHADTIIVRTADQWKQHIFGLTDHITRPE
jgi:hypothetical protein